MLEIDHPLSSLKSQAELVGASYSSLIYQPLLPLERELGIKRQHHQAALDRNR